MTGFYAIEPVKLSEFKIFPLHCENSYFDNPIKSS